MLADQEIRIIYLDTALDVDVDVDVATATNVDVVFV